MSAKQTDRNLPARYVSMENPGDHRMNRRAVLVAATALAGTAALGSIRTVQAQEASGLPSPATSPTGAATLFENVRIFDGRSAMLSAPSHVLVRGNVIERISTAPIAADAGVTVVAAAARVLMPGLSDMHWHAMLVRPTPADFLSIDARPPRR